MITQKVNHERNCELTGTKDGKSVSSLHSVSCPMFISKRVIAIVSRRIKSAKKWEDPRETDFHKAARKHLRIERAGKNWAITYHGRGCVSGLVPDFMPMPMKRDRELNPDSIYAQITGALVSFALDALNDPQFRSKRKEKR